MPKVELSKDETDLLQLINQSVSANVRQRYEMLNEKLHEETITPDEYREFLELIDQIELAHAERLHQLIKLAQLRNVPVETLMNQLGIRQPALG